jgi:hypothetical protein
MCPDIRLDITFRQNNNIQKDIWLDRTASVSLRQFRWTQDLSPLTPVNSLTKGQIRTKGFYFFLQTLLRLEGACWLSLHFARLQYYRLTVFFSSAGGCYAPYCKQAKSRRTFNKGVALPLFARWLRHIKRRHWRAAWYFYKTT